MQDAPAAPQSRPQLPMWIETDIAAAAAAAMRRKDATDAAADAVRGLDALDELDLHPILAQGFRRAGFGAVREHPFPGPKGKRAKKSERERCDLVLTPRHGVRIRDPMREEEVEEDQRAGTLFAGGEGPVPEGVPSEECYWLEVKSVGQFVYVDGVPRANSAYASQLVRGIMGDLAKLRREKRVRHGAVLLVLCTAERAVAEHDLPAALHKALDRGSVMRAPVVEGFPILDRVGNAWCCVALIPTAGDGDPDA